MKCECVCAKPSRCQYYTYVQVHPPVDGLPPPPLWIWRLGWWDGWASVGLTSYNKPPPPTSFLGDKKFLNMNIISNTQIILVIYYVRSRISFEISFLSFTPPINRKHNCFIVSHIHKELSKLIISTETTSFHLTFSSKLISQWERDFSVILNSVNDVFSMC